MIKSDYKNDFLFRTDWDQHASKTVERSLNVSSELWLE